MKLFNKLNDQKFWDEVEFYRFSIMMITITFGTCIASIAVYYILKPHPFDFFIPLLLITLLAMASNTAAIAQSPIKWVVGTFGLSTVFSILVILYSILF